MRDPEPFFKDIPSSLDMTLAFNWFAENCSWADSKKYIVTYLINNGMKDKADTVKKMPEYEISWVCGWVCRLLTNKSKVTKKDEEYLNEYISHIKEK